MFEKFKANLIINKITFLTTYKVSYNVEVNKNNVIKKNYLLNSIFSRPSEFIKSNGKLGKPDYTTSDGMPIWIVELNPRDYLDAAIVLPIISKIGMVSPFVTDVTNVVTGKNVGYMVVIPDTLKCTDDKVYKFVIGHEIGHIECDHLSRLKSGSVSKNINFEYEADKFGMNFAGIKDTSEMNIIFEKMFSIIFKTTFSTIRRLNKYNNDEDITFIIKNWTPVKKRIRFLINN